MRRKHQKEKNRRRPARDIDGGGRTCTGGGQDSRWHTTMGFGGSRKEATLFQGGPPVTQCVVLRCAVRGARALGRRGDGHFDVPERSRARRMDRSRGAHHPNPVRDGEICLRLRPARQQPAAPQRPNMPLPPHAREPTRDELMTQGS